MPHGFLGRCRSLDIGVEFHSTLTGEGYTFLFGPAPDQNTLERHGGEHGLELRACLEARANDGEAAGLGTRQELSCERAGGARADLAQVIRFDQGEGRSVLSPV